MKNPKKILVPTDFSLCSQNALLYAIQFAVNTRATIHLLNVATIDVKETDNPFTAEGVLKEKKKSIQNSFEELLGSVKRKLNNEALKSPDITTYAEFGSVSQKIADIAKRESIDLIIMGTQGENSIADRLMGSTASNLVKESPVPMILIPEGVVFSPIIRMGYTSNLEDGDPFRIWKAIHLFQPASTEVVYCVHFSENEDRSDEKLAEFELFFKETIPQLKMDFTSIRTSDKIQGINNFCAENDINLIVMYRTPRNLWQYLFKGSFTEEMSKQVFAPLLILKDENHN